ncbi:hypothetical protein BCV70DRAFT_3362 [Testicularia cyperi]|uniref:Zinc finger PHD-type domain-containing protein n=1 Tax=Testicularia cyperi TaxID=1882483 RepID=A0A317XWY4_9BASI|nr:hypothetical protein BCV70DRAFT_3362 [Testicularia cyperi]
MAPRSSRAPPATTTVSADEPASSAADTIAADAAETTTSAMKAEAEHDLESTDIADASTNGEPQTHEVTSAAAGEGGENGSRESSEPDDKPNASPSKRASVKSKKGSKASRSKSASSKRSSEEHDAPAKDGTETTETTAADADTLAEASTSVEQPATADVVTTDIPADAANIEPETTPDPGPSTGKREGSTSSDAGTASNNGTSSRRQRSSSTNKELAQLGLGSFGDGQDDDVVGPRRSRRAPGGSPEPKTRVFKEEQGLDNELSQTADAMQADAADSHYANGNGTNSPVLDGFPTEADGSVKAGLAKVDETAPEDGEVDNTDADDDANAEADGEGGDEGVTRCVCGSSDENVGLMIQCETCKCWQHCVCMGMQFEEDCPDVYYCEQCRPELHIPLLRSLGLLPKGGKKNGGKSTKYSARELKEAKEAIAMLAQENARRAQAAEAAAAAANFNSRDRKASSHSRNDPANGKEVPKSPKRRSTMNSRDSAYGGWEPLPPGLLAEGEVWDGGDEDRKGAKKRKRGGPDDGPDSRHGTAEAGDEQNDSFNDLAKRRRMSGALTSAAGQHDDDGDLDMIEDEDESNADQSAGSKATKKRKGNNQYTVRESSAVTDAGISAKPRHPNQYTYRKQGRGAGVVNAAANTGANGKTGSSSTSNLTSHSPSPSPSKSRAEAARRGVAKENGSRMGTPAPAGESSSSNRGASNYSAAQWGLPEHLTHLAYLLPVGAIRSSLPSTSKGAATGSSSLSKRTSNNLYLAAPGTGTSTPTHFGLLPPAGTASPAPFRIVSSIESSTKVRFPGRRMTMGEMRKRVRNIGEYVTRSQIEAVEREKRMRLLGIVPPYAEEELDEHDVIDELPGDDAAAGQQPDGIARLTAKQESAAEADASHTATQPMHGADEETSADTGKSNSANGSRSPYEQLPLSMRLMEELTHELINFQKRFGVGPGNHGSLSSSQTPAIVG